MPLTLAQNLSKAQEYYQQAAAVIQSDYAARAPNQSTQVTPRELTAAVDQFFSLAKRLDRHDDAESMALAEDEISEIGDFGLQLLGDLATWARQLGLADAGEKLGNVALAVAGWIVRHHGEIRTPELIVDTLAQLANRTNDHDELTEVMETMSAVLDAISGPLKQDLEASNPGRPLRVLQFNRAIVATRTHSPENMRRVFDEFVSMFPGEAAEFFTQGMEQMTKLDYPEPVRKIMRKYYDQWCEGKLH